MKLALVNTATDMIENIVKVDPDNMPTAPDGFRYDETGLRIGDVLIDGVWVGVLPDPAELLAQERAAMVCTRQQGKLALGPTVWASVLALADEPDTPWGLKVAIEDTVEWRRTNEDMQALVWAIGLTEEQADDLFRLAMIL